MRSPAFSFTAVRLARGFATGALLAALAACGGHGGSGGGGSTAPTVTVTTAAGAVTTAQSLNVNVSVSGAAQGVVTLSSGAFSAGVATLSGGSASFTVPAGVLPAGSDTLTANYTPATAGTTAASGMAMVTVSAATAPTVSAQSTDLLVSGHPFSAIPVGSNVLVSVTNNGASGSQATGVNVYRAASPAQLSFQCTQAVTAASAFGLAPTPNGANVGVAVEAAGVDVLSVLPLTSACNSGENFISQATSNPGTFDLAITADGKYAFIANEDGVVAQDSTGANIPGNVAVVALSYDATGKFTSGKLLGQFSTGGGYIAGVTLSPDGTRLYVTSEIAQPGPTVSGTANATLAHNGCTQAAGVPPSTYGLLSVVDVGKAEATPTSAAIIATVASGCSPVRIVETSDNQVIWVAARGDNNVLAFSTHMLESDPNNALLGYGNTGGIAPVGLQLFHNQQLLAVANSNRFASPDIGNMTIMSATPVNPAVLTTVTTTYFPRNLSNASDDATLYLTDYDGGKVQIISTQVK